MARLSILLLAKRQEDFVMSYTFGKEIVKFTLNVLSPGETTAPNWGPTTVYIDPETMAILKDDESSDPFFQVIHLPAEQPPDPFVGIELKVLKPVWEIDLHYFSRGGVDYEVHEGMFEYMEEWGPAAAEIFQEHFKASRLTQSDSHLIARSIPEQPTYDSFYGLVNSWWSGSHDYWEDDLSFEMEFLGEIDETKLEQT